MKIVWSPLALERVAEISDYIAQDNPAAAINWVETLFAKVQQLKTSPQSGRVVPETRRENIRELIYGNYRVIYRVENGQSSILTVRHGRQILPTDELPS